MPLISVNPKLPMRNLQETVSFYTTQLGFHVFGTTVYDDYVMLEKDGVQLHFFAYKDLNPLENYGQVYIRVKDIEAYYQSLLDNQTPIHPNGPLQTKPWGQKEFSVLDPDHNLLTFGERM